MNLTMKKTMIASSVALALGAPVANAALVTNIFGAYDWSTDRANFTMLTGGGGINGGTNDVAMAWNGNGFNASSDYTGPGSVANVTATSTTPFFNYTWTAHDIQVFTPGTYSFDTSLGGGAPETAIMTATVGPTQLGMHMLFDWNGNFNLDVFVVATGGAVFGSGVGASAIGAPCTSTTLNCLWTGKGFAGGDKLNAPDPTKAWMLASVDGDADGTPGIKMVPGGAFPGFEANFNANLTPTPDAVVPVPAAVWLFGSGLLGLVGIGRRNRKS
jgi:hypothetical protein